jgi:hypothetical protein
MLPLVEAVLTLQEIAEYWSREIDGIRTIDQVYSELLSKFWQGELGVTDLTGAHKNRSTGYAQDRQLSAGASGIHVY